MKAYLQLCKLRIALMTAGTAYVGYRLAGGVHGENLSWTLLGVTLASCGTGALNQFWERDLDAKMKRTASRPLPQGLIDPQRALFFGLACALSGVALLAWKTNLLAAGWTALTVVLYVLVYTPLKTVTPHSTWVGAITGATPPLIGWAAAAGGLHAHAWALFAIQFLWQIPHFLAIFWNYREDYARAGFRVMPVVDPTGASTALQIAIHSLALLFASVLPFYLGLGTLGYTYAALAMGSAFLLLGLRASWTLEIVDTRRLFFASLIYLPVLFGILLYGRIT